MADAPVRVGGGYIEVRPKLVGLADFKRQLKARFETLGKEASSSLLRGVQRGMGDSMDSLMKSTNRAVAGLGRVAAEEQKAFAKIRAAEIAAAARVEAARIAAAEKGAARREAVERTHVRNIDRAHAQALTEQTRRDAAALANQQRTQTRFNNWYNAQHRQRSAMRRQDMAAFEAEFRRVIGQTDRLSRAANQGFRSYFNQLNRGRDAAYRLNQEIGFGEYRISRFSRQLSSAMDEQSRWLSYSAEGVRQFGNRLQSFGQSWTSYITAPILGSIGAVASWGLQTAATIEKAQLGLTALYEAQGVELGRATVIAKANLADLREYAEKTAFSFGDMANGVQRLAASGIAAKTGVEWMQALGDTAATSGAGMYEMRRAIIALTQSMDAERIVAQDMNQLQNAGIPIWMILSDIYKKNRLELLDMAKAGQLQSRDVWPKLIKWMQRYQGNAQKMAKAVPLENLRNQIEQFKNELADVMSGQDRFGNVIDPETPRQLNRLFQTLGETLRASVPVFRGFIKDILPVLNAGLLKLKAAFLFLQRPENEWIRNLILAAAVVGPLAIAVGLFARTVGFLLSPLGFFTRLLTNVDTNGRGARGALAGVRGELGGILKLVNVLAGVSLAKGALKLVGGGIKKGAGRAARAARDSRAGQVVGDKADEGRRKVGAAGIIAGAGLEKLLSKFPLLSKFVSKVGVLRGLLRTPWGGAAIAAVAAFVASLVGAYKNSTYLQFSVNALKTALGRLFSTIGASLGPIWGGIKAAFLSTGVGADGAGGKLQSLGEAMAVVVDKITVGVNWLRSNWGAIAAGFVVAFQVWVSIISGTLSPLLSGLWAIIKAVAGAAWGLVQTVYQAAVQFLNWTGILDSSSESTKQAAIQGGTLGKVIVYAIAAFSTAGKVMIAIVSVVKIVAMAFAGLIEILSGITQSLFKLFTFDFKGAWKALAGGFSSAWSKIWGAIKDSGGSIAGIFDWNKTKKGITDNFNDIFDKIKVGGGKKSTPRTPGKPPGDRGGSGTGGGTGSGSGSGGGKEDPKEKAKREAEAAKKRFEAAKRILLDSFKSFLGSLKGNADQVKKAGDRLVKSVRSAFAKIGKSKIGEQAAKYLERVNKRLVAIAKQRDAILKRLEEAREFRSNVTDAAKESAKFGNLPYSLTTAEGVKQGLMERLAKIKQFVGVVKQLAKRGLAKGLLRQVVDMGPIEGLALGKVLLSADQATWKAINSAQSQIDKAAKELGNSATEVIFGSIPEMEKKGKALQDRMEKIARAAIAKVARQFGIGWKDIRQITGMGINQANARLSDGLRKTKTHVSSATGDVKRLWSNMVGSMNDSTKSLVSVTYTKGVKGTVDAMAKIGGVKTPAPSIKYADGGMVPGFAPRRDVVPAMLSPGEGVMVPELARQVGPGRLKSWNKAARAGGNVFRDGGMVNGWDWVNAHKDAPYKGYDEALNGAIGAVIDPAVKSLSRMSGDFSRLEGQDVRAGYPPLHEWTKGLDKKAAEGGNAAHVIASAMKEYTGNQGYGDGAKYNKWYGMSGAPWCAMFVSYVAEMANSVKAYWGVKSAAVATFKNAARSAGRLLPVSAAQPGDTAFYRGTGHINFVIRNLGNGRLLTIGGNESDTIRRQIRSDADSVGRPSLPKSGNGDFVNPWPGSLKVDPSGDLGGGVDNDPRRPLPGYARGAWKIKRDHIAKIHRGEMVVPRTPAHAIREGLRGRRLYRANRETTYQVTINAAPDIPTERTVIKALSYAHTMYG